MPFALVGISHRTAPVEIREQVFVPSTLAGECVRRLIDRDVIESGMVLSTCNRTELYGFTASEEGSHQLFSAFGLWPHELPFEVWQRHAYRLDGEEAMTHLFEVACGLDSTVIGEGQILGQIRAALGQARAAGVVDPRLEIVLHGALRAGKRTRHETEIGRKPVSVAHAAVAKAREVLGALDGRGVLVVGTGTMSEVALRLLDNERIAPPYLVSRTLERADRVVRERGGRALPFDRIADVIAEVDIILSSTGAPHQLFDKTLVEAFQARRDGRPLLIIDMAVPRDVHPDVGLVDGVRLLNIDDLQTIARANRDARHAWIPAAQQIVAEEIRATERALDARQPAATIKALIDRATQMREDVLQRQLAQLSEDDGRTAAALRALAESLTARLLHGPIRVLRESPDAMVESAVISDAFELNDDRHR